MAVYTLFFLFCKNFLFLSGQEEQKFPTFFFILSIASFSKALELDALSSSHAIEVKVGHPAEVDQIFDSISYNKGASIIRQGSVFWFWI